MSLVTFEKAFNTCAINAEDGILMHSYLCPMSVNKCFENKCFKKSLK